MCTAVTWQAGDHYFGRTLDLEHSFGEEVVVMPRCFPYVFSTAVEPSRRYALMGIAHVADGQPLYYEAVNEKGLGMAGLNFPCSAVYHERAEVGRKGVPSFDLIPWVLMQCADVAQARTLLEKTQVLRKNFDEHLPCTPLHWLVADKAAALSVEPLESGLCLWENKVGVLTNEPPFDSQMFYLQTFLNLSRAPMENRFAPALELSGCSRGMGAVGLPGDLSSPSRFVRAAFTLCNAVPGEGEEGGVSQLFHVLQSVAQHRGCVEIEKDVYEITRYTSCCNTDKGIWYYTTYDNPTVTAIDMHRCDLSGEKLFRYPLKEQMEIQWQN